jgi:hypothetical protein
MRWISKANTPLGDGAGGHELSEFYARAPCVKCHSGYLTSSRRQGKQRGVPRSMSRPSTDFRII